MGNYSFHTRRTSEATLDWEALPLLDDDRAFRAVAWRIILSGLTIFWIGVGIALWSTM